MSRFQVDEATRAALRAGDMRKAVRALTRANPGLGIRDIPAALEAVRAQAGGALQQAGGTHPGPARATTSTGGRVPPATTTGQALHAAAVRRVPTVAPGDGGSLGALRLLALVTAAAVVAALWWLARG